MKVKIWQLEGEKTVRLELVAEGQEDKDMLKLLYDRMHKEHPRMLYESCSPDGNGGVTEVALETTAR